MKKFLTSLLLVITVASFSPVVFADEYDDLLAKNKAAIAAQAEADSAFSELKVKFNSYNQAKAKYEPLLSQVNAAQAKIDKGLKTNDKDLHAEGYEELAKIENVFNDAREKFVFAEAEYSSAKENFETKQTLATKLEAEVKKEANDLKFKDDDKLIDEILADLDKEDEEAAAKEKALADKKDAENFDDQRGTVLPSTQFDSVEECEIIMFYVSNNRVSAKTTVAKRSPLINIENGPQNVTSNDILACGIRTGNMKLWMVPFYIRFILEFIIGLAGLITVGAVVYGGYLYLFSGISDDKDQGKNALKNGIIGLVLVLSAWAIVNVFMALVSI